MKRKVNLVLSAIFGLALTTGAASAAGLSYTTEYVWNQGDTPVILGVKGDEGVCFLTYVRGKFSGGEEHFEVVIDNNEWKLKGHSNQNYVRGKARCIVGVKPK